MAADITAALRALDPDDPVRYDFALCHLSMMGACGFATKQGDTQCPLRTVAADAETCGRVSARSPAVPQERS